MLNKVKKLVVCSSSLQNLVVKQNESFYRLQQ